MKISLFILIFCIVLITTMQLLNLLSLSPILVFLAAFGIASILLLLSMLVFAKKRRNHE